MGIEERTQDVFFCQAFETCSVELSRRRFIGLIAFSGLAVFAPRADFAAIRDVVSVETSLSFCHPNTKEALDTIYWSNGNYRSEALAHINYIMRGRWIGEIDPRDVSLLHFLYAIGMKIKTQKPLHILLIEQIRHLHLTKYLTLPFIWADRPSLESGHARWSAHKGPDTLPSHHSESVMYGQHQQRHQRPDPRGQFCQWPRLLPPKQCPL